MLARTGIEPRPLHQALMGPRKEVNMHPYTGAFYMTILLLPNKGAINKVILPSKGAINKVILPSKGAVTIYTLIWELQIM